MWFIVLFVFLIIFFLSPHFRCICTHFISTIRYGVVDFVKYIRQKKYNLYGTGVIIAYVGLFGKGKTLSAVHRVVSAYHLYDGREVWDPRRKKFVTQRIKIISNVSLSVPYEDFISLEQIILDAERKQEYDDLNDTLTITLVLGDEFSVQLNSRNFKKNIDPLFLNTLLTCRHYHISLFYTAQRFNQVDALLRQVTSTVIDCRKIWRLQGQWAYDAWEMENSTNPSVLRPLHRDCWFVRDADYNAYDTLATVGNLRKEVDAGNMMTEEEILSLQVNQGSGMDAVERPSRGWRRARRKK